MPNTHNGILGNTRRLYMRAKIVSILWAMMQLRHMAFDLPFEYPFTTSKGTKTHQSTLVVGLGMRQWMGLGEAPAISYYDIDVPSMQASLERNRGEIERYALIDPKRFWHFLHHLIPGEHFLTAALDIAGWDLFSRMRNQPLYQLLNLPKRPLLTDYTIGSDTVEAMLSKIQVHPWQVYKIKMTDAGDIDLLRKMREITASPFRIDANEALTYEDTLRLLPEWKKLGVAIVEQPLPRLQQAEMIALKAQSPLPLMADESCQTEIDLDGCAKGFHGINIKLTKCGGITPALRMMEKARSLGLTTMLGTMSESTIGTAALGHLSGAADLLDADGPLLLKSDVATGIAYEAGILTVSDKPGLGVQFYGNNKPQ